MKCLFSVMLSIFTLKLVQPFATGYTEDTFKKDDKESSHDENIKKVIAQYDDEFLSAHREKPLKEFEKVKNLKTINPSDSYFINNDSKTIKKYSNNYFTPNNSVNKVQFILSNSTDNSILLQTVLFIKNSEIKNKTKRSLEYFKPGLYNYFENNFPMNPEIFYSNRKRGLPNEMNYHQVPQGAFFPNSPNDIRMQPNFKFDPRLRQKNYNSNFQSHYGEPFPRMISSNHYSGISRPDMNQGANFKEISVADGEKDFNSNYEYGTEEYDDQNVKDSAGESEEVEYNYKEQNSSTLDLNSNSSTTLQPPVSNSTTETKPKREENIEENDTENMKSEDKSFILNKDDREKEMLPIFKYIEKKRDEKSKLENKNDSVQNETFSKLSNETIYCCFPLNATSVDGSSLNQSLNTKSSRSIKHDYKIRNKIKKNLNRKYQKQDNKIDKVEFSKLGKWFDTEMAEVQPDVRPKYQNLRKKSKYGPKYRYQNDIAKSPSYKESRLYHKYTYKKPYNTKFASKKRDEQQKSQTKTFNIDNRSGNIKSRDVSENLSQVEKHKFFKTKRNPDFTRHLAPSFERRSSIMANKVGNEFKKMKPVSRDTEYFPEFQNWRPNANMKSRAVEKNLMMNVIPTTDKPDLIDKTNDVLSKAVVKAPNVDEKMERVKENFKTKKTTMKDKKADIETNIIENEKEKIEDDVRVISRNQMNATESEQNVTTFDKTAEYEDSVLTDTYYDNLKPPNEFSQYELPPNLNQYKYLNKKRPIGPFDRNPSVHKPIYNYDVSKMSQPQLLSSNKMPYGYPQQNLLLSNQMKNTRPDLQISGETVDVEANASKPSIEESKPIAFKHGELVAITTEPPYTEFDKDQDSTEGGDYQDFNKLSDKTIENMEGTATGENPEIKESLEYSTETLNSTSPDVYLKEEKVEKESKTLLRNKVAFRNETAKVKGVRKSEIKNNKESYHETFLEQKDEDKYPSLVEVSESHMELVTVKAVPEDEENELKKNFSPESSKQNNKISDLSGTASNKQRFNKIQNRLESKSKNYMNEKVTYDGQKQHMNTGEDYSKSDESNYDYGGKSKDSNYDFYTNDQQYSNAYDDDPNYNYGNANVGDRYINSGRNQKEYRLQRQSANENVINQDENLESEEKILNDAKEDSQNNSNSNKTIESEAEQSAGNIVYVPLSTTTPQYNDFLQIREDKKAPSRRRHIHLNRPFNRPS